ncbi:unnamed protein product [Prorocentrum cordatum]|nr:unnamed protein product [Polarella glacialis]
MPTSRIPSASEGTSLRLSSPPACRSWGRSSSRLLKAALAVPLGCCRAHGVGGPGQAPRGGRFRVDVWFGEGRAALEVSALATAAPHEAAGPAVTGRVPAGTSSAELLPSLCRWLHGALPLRAPPPAACVDVGCRCEDEPELLELAASVGPAGAARGREHSSSAGPALQDTPQSQSVLSCAHVAGGAGGGCAGRYSGYCPRSCGLCSKGYVVQTSRKKAALPSSYCQDRNRSPWAWFAADGSPLAGPPRLPASLLVLEAGAFVPEPGDVGRTVAFGAGGVQFRTLATSPALFQSAGALLSAAEAAELIAVAEGRLETSVVEAPRGGRGKTSHASRTSMVAWLSPEDGAAARRVFTLGAEILSASVNQFERLQVVRYRPGEFYHQHFDYFEYWEYPRGSPAQREMMKRTRKGAANRVATLLWYLTEDPGATTDFPLAGGQENNLTVGDIDWTECGRHGLSVPARLGSAVLFYHMLANGTLDRRAMHAGCPPEGGRVKWVANLWLWNRDDVSDYDEALQGTGGPSRQRGAEQRTEI